MSSIKAVIFDMDNVLFDYRRPQRLAILSDMSGIAEAEIDRLIFSADFEEDADRGVYDLAAYVAETNRILGSDLTLEQMYEARISAMTADRQMIDLALALKAKVKLALLTNNGEFLASALPRFFPEAAEIFGAHAYFSGLLGLSKPDPAAFLAVCGRLGAKPEETLFIDDSAQYISGAREAGLLVHHFTKYEKLLPVLRQAGLID